LKIIVAMPAYNEAEAIGPLLEKIVATLEAAEQEYRVVVVDDGSRDATADLVREKAAAHQGPDGESPIRLVQHKRNQGLAAAMRTAFREACALADPEDTIVTLDADETHTPDHIPGMVHALQEGADVVVASRYRRGAAETGVSFPRRLFSLGARILCTFLFHLPGVRDYTSGYRAYRAGLLQSALAHYGDRFIEARGFAATMEILLKLRRFRPRFAEVPLALRYDLKPGASKLRLGRTLADYARVIGRALGG
jgi:dolichol-phosphate mannosyltransferase